MLYSQLYEYLDGFTALDIDDIFNQIIKEWTNEQVEAFVGKLFLEIKMDYFENPSYFNFYANSTLGGAAYPCSALECRLNNLDNLLRFSALYADKVLIQSPIDAHYERLESDMDIDRVSLATDIIILLYIKPLVLNGIVGFFSSYICLCQECLKKIVKKEDDIKSSLEEMQSFIYDDCYKNIQCTLQRDEDGVAYFAIQGAEKYGYHKQTDILFVKEPQHISELLLDKASVKLTSKMMKKFGVIEDLINPAVNDLFQAQINTMFLDSSYITNRVFDAEIIEFIKNKDISGDLIDRANLISDDLFHRVPLISDVRVEDIVELRLKDGQSFVNYRDSLNRILKDYKKLDRKAITEIQRDIIDPELHSIERTISLNRSSLLKAAGRDVILTGLGVGIGLFSGILPFDYAAVLGVMGGIPTLSNILSNIGKGNSKGCVKNNNFYFLFKLQDKYKRL